MKWSKPPEGPPGRRGYHHGNLREALIRGALALIAEKGPAGFTIADAARSAGVSPAAPYRHFRDRDDLMADVARLGFQEFTARLAKAWNDGKPDAMSAFENVGRAYLAFARDEPAFYAAMFEAGVPAAPNPELRQAGDSAFEILRHASEALVASLPKERRPPSMMMALHIWAISHGIASLFVRAGSRKTPMAPEELLEAAMLVYFQGLGLSAKSAGA
ncbi:MULTISPECIES: TetR/AcrR family transcriptional regulator [Rhodomicrobium]|uniref:TetR/AcrR family transcriptional regulator n=1 Tax=Rhodomicrobium TaxID=1068 RepID=UPI000B4AC76E|nr:MULTISPECIES: TetR/AcrR family transcriptional regulator [Rhodomicrobium]